MKWHFIGHLQRNKARQVVETGAVVETVDRAKLVTALDRRVHELGRHPCRPIEVLLQVNVAGEASKSGCDPGDLPALLAAAAAADHVRVKGLMTIPPAGEDARPWFQALRRLAAAHQLRELSMGMSADLEVAIEEGATIVRVGTAIFGPRPA